MRFKMDFSRLPKCGARTKSSGEPCRHPALSNGRCHYHGGKSKMKHGNDTKQAKAMRHSNKEFIRKVQDDVSKIHRLIQEFESITDDHDIDHAQQS